MGEEEEEVGVKGENEKKKEEEGGEEKKAAPPTEEEIVLKVDMHCEACARKVVRALKGFPGVEEVKADYKASKVVVVVKAATGVDPIKVSQRIHKKSGRKVELISPLPPPPPPTPPPTTPNLQNEKQQDPPKQPDKTLPQSPAATTVVLKVQMHCEACAQGLKKGIGKIKGVESVETDIASNQVTVKSVLDPEKLVSNVSKKTHKHVSIVKNEEKKDKEEAKQDENKQVEEQGMEDDGKVDVKKTEYWPPKHYTEYAYAHDQMFSDENPNACSVM